MSSKAYTTAVYDFRDVNIQCEHCGAITSYKKKRIKDIKILNCKNCHEESKIVFDVASYRHLR